MRRNSANKANADIRDCIASKKLYMWQVANMCGIADTTLTKWMREELSEEDPRRKLIMKTLQDYEGEV